MLVFDATSGTATTILKGQMDLVSNNGTISGASSYGLDGMGSSRTTISSGTQQTFSFNNDSATGGVIDYVNTIGTNGILIRSNQSITIDTLTGLLILSNIPTSSSGLPTGAVWNNGGVLNIV